jgi:hypothetical protein
MLEYVWNILRPFDIFFGHFNNLLVNWNIPPPVLVYCIAKNLAALLGIWFKVAKGRFLTTSFSPGANPATFEFTAATPAL